MSIHALGAYLSVVVDGSFSWCTDYSSLYQVLKDNEAQTLIPFSNIVITCSILLCFALIFINIEGNVLYATFLAHCSCKNHVLTSLSRLTEDARGNLLKVC